jgi:hypothetical protein
MLGVNIRLRFAIKTAWRGLTFNCAQQVRRASRADERGCAAGSVRTHIIEHRQTEAFLGFENAIQITTVILKLICCETAGTERCD